MATGIEIDAAKLGEDPEMVEELRKESKGFRRVMDKVAAGAAVLSISNMREIFNRGVKKSTVRNIATEYIKARKVVWTLHGGNHTDICLSLEGKTWDADSAHPEPPVHFNCKSTLEPYYDSGHLLSGVFNG